MLSLTHSITLSEPFALFHSPNNFLAHSHRLEQEKVRASSSWHLKKSGAPPGVVPDELTDKASENEGSPSAGKPEIEPAPSSASAAPFHRASSSKSGQKNEPGAKQVKTTSSPDNAPLLLSSTPQLTLRV